MLSLKINNTPYKIKQVHELTTKEFIELSTVENLDVIKYIQFQTGLKFDDCFFATVPKNIEYAIGGISDITKLKRSPKFDYKKTIDTIGQRHQIEESGLSGYPLIVFILAVSQVRSTNIDDVLKLRDQYLNEPYTEIIPSGVFFLKILTNGKPYVKNCLKKLAQLIKTFRLKNKPE